MFRLGTKIYSCYQLSHHSYELFFSYACTIQLFDYVLITGGSDTKTYVTKYDVNGWVENLPGLNTGRRAHGCSYFYDNDNKLVDII